MVRIDAFGMPSEELIARIEAEAGVGNREIVSHYRQQGHP